MAGMSLVATLLGKSGGQTTNIADLGFARVNGTLVIISATPEGGGLSAFLVREAEGEAKSVGFAPYLAGTGWMGDPKLVFSGQDSAECAAFAAGLRGGFRSGVDFDKYGRIDGAASVSLPTNVLSASGFVIGDNQYFLVARAGRAGVETWRLTDSGAISQVSDVPFTLARAGSQINDVAVASVGGAAFALSASTAGNFITSHRVSASGGLSTGQTIGQGWRAPFSNPTQIEAVTSGSAAFVVVAGAGSSSLTVMRIGTDGMLRTVDHILDERTTRFAGVTEMATITVDGRGYVFVGGRDDGISMFAVLPDGRLMHVATLADTSAMPLARVSALAAAELDGQIVLAAASGSERGIAQFRVDVGTIGTTAVTGTSRYTGGAGDDLLVAGKATTSLAGGEGNDTLAAGGTSVSLSGGKGADVFMPTAIHGRITITDFEPSKDRLDLSDLGMIRSPGQLVIRQVTDGLLVTFGATTIQIRSADGNTLSTSVITGAAFPIAHYDTPGEPIFLIGTDRGEVLTAGLNQVNAHGLGGNDTLLGGYLADSLVGGNGADRIEGRSGNDMLEGGRDADRLEGGSGVDRLSGAEGNDTLFGGTGNDRLTGGTGADRLGGQDGNDLIFGEGHNDHLNGGSGNDTLNGGSGNDGMMGGVGDDSLSDTLGTNSFFGEAGNDTLRGGASRDIMNGGTGRDQLDGAAGNDVLAGGPDRDSILAGTGNDKLRGDEGRDTLRGDDGRDTLDGGHDNDLLSGGRGADLLNGQDGSDRLLGGADNDILHGGDGNDTAQGGDGNDRLTGAEGNDRLYGENGSDLLSGSAGNDRIEGGRGGDTLVGSSGNDRLDGGTENDLLDGGPGRDVLVGGSGNDRLTGGTGSDTLSGGSGNDRILTGGGRDLAYGGTGNDTLIASHDAAYLRGDGGNDLIFGAGSNDTLKGYEGTDTIQGSAGADHVAGGSENDRLYGGAGNDTILGETGNDRITGDLGNDRLSGGYGADLIYGGSGNDVLSGDAGADTLWGGSGADRFVFRTGDGNAARTGDEIRDFRHTEDHVDLTAMKLTFAGNSFSGDGREVIAIAGTTTTQVQIDLNGDGRADFVIRLTGATGVTAGDFLL